MSKHILKNTLFRTCQISHGPRPGVLHPWAIAPSGACSTCFQSMPHQTCCGPCCLCVITCAYILGFTFAFSISLLHWCTMAQKMINNSGGGWDSNKSNKPPFCSTCWFIHCFVNIYPGFQDALTCSLSTSTFNKTLTTSTSNKTSKTGPPSTPMITMTTSWMQLLVLVSRTVFCMLLLQLLLLLLVLVSRTCFCILLLLLLLLLLVLVYRIMLSLFLYDAVVTITVVVGPGLAPEPCRARHSGCNPTWPA